MTRVLLLQDGNKLLIVMSLDNRRSLHLHTGVVLVLTRRLLSTLPVSNGKLSGHNYKVYAIGRHNPRPIDASMLQSFGRVLASRTETSLPRTAIPSIR